MTALPTGTVTLLFTDIEGSTQLLHRLGDRYALLLADHHRIIEGAIAAHGGVVVDTQGDSFFAAFPGALAAVGAAADAQRALAAQPWPEGVAVRVRMGLHTGEPLPTGARYVGLAVHHAARVGAAGHGGQVLLSAATVALVRARLPEGLGLRDLGAHRLKDIPEPEPIHQLLIPGLTDQFPPLKTLDPAPASPAASQPPAALPAPALPLVGRARERGILAGCLDAALAGRGGLALLGGEAGIGKTTLAEDVCREAAERGALVLVGRCYDLSETPPYGPWLEAVRGYHAGDGLPPLPAFVTDPTALRAIPSAAALHAETFAFFAAVAATRPLVILLEDLHWADLASLDLLRAVARQLAGMPLLLVATYRADELTRRHPLYALLPLLEREARATRLDLRRLDPAGVRALVAARHALPAADAERLVAWLVARAEGNAFFSLQLLRALADEGVLHLADDGWTLGDLGAVGLPTALRQVLDARLARLGEEVHRLLTLAAVIGQEVQLTLWATVAETDEDGLLDAIDAATDAYLVAVAPDGATIRFAHALIREALYEGMLATRRRRVHRRVAEALAATVSPDPDWVASHFERAGDDRAEAWLDRAADRARRAWAWVTAAERLEATLALAERRGAGPGERGWLLLRLGLLRRHDDRPQAMATLTAAGELVAQSADPLLGAYVRFAAGLVRSYLLDLRAGVADMEAAVAALGALSPFDAATRTRLRGWGLADDPDHQRGTLALWYAQVGRHAETIALAESVAARGVDSGAGWLDGAFAPDALRGLGRAHAALGRPTEAQSALEGNVAAYRAVGDHGQAIGTLRIILRSVFLAYRADDLAGRRWVATEIERAEARIGGNQRTMLARLSTSPLLLVEGRWAEARMVCDAAALSGPRDIEWLYKAGMAALLAWWRGDRSAARALVSEVFPFGPATEQGDMHHEFHGQPLVLAAALALDEGDLAAADAWLRRYDRLLTWSGAVLGLAEGQLGWATYHRAAGDPDRACQHAEAALAHASEPRQPLALLAAHRLLGELDTEAGNHADAAAQLAAALTLADACAAPYERALTLLALAQLHAAEGDREAARIPLAEARAVFADLGARPALARADALAATLDAPAPVSPPSAAPPHGLTAREAEVLALLAGGLSNAAIADRLSLSRRTVEQHLRSVYDKLGVDNRTAAARAAVERGLA